MSHSPSPSSDAGTTIIGALVSLVTFSVSFFNSSHAWLQNTTYLVSLIAGCIAIYSGIKNKKK